MRSLLVLLLLPAAALFAQNDRGTITGTVSDPAGAVVANGAIEARNLENGATYQTASSETGNYTLAQLPVGNYELSVTVSGFKRYVRTGLAVQVAQTMRIDVSLEVGSAAESVTVTDAAPLLKTESGELSHTIAGAKLADLPILGTGAQNASTWGMRNAYSFTQLLPGTLFNSNTNIRVNGAVSNTQTIAIEGQDATDRFLPYSTVMTQPSADAIQEVAVQTSNFAAEFGQVGGGYFNMTMKSGTNQFHGTAYNYYANEAFNASQPYTNLKEVTRRNNFGFALGGPLVIPKIYDGRNKTFFYYNLEYFRQNQVFNTVAQTVPTDLYRLGNFSQAMTAANNRVLATDPLSRSIIENMIYDPLTERAAPNGAIVRDPFLGNIIPAARLDPVAAKVQALIPRATSPALINNIVPVFSGPTRTNFPSIKGDQQIGQSMKLSVYWTESANVRPYSPGTGNADGLPDTITAARGNFIGSHTERVNFEASLSPTLLLHLGAGYQHLDFQDRSPTLNYDSFKELGLRGQTMVRNFPQFAGLSTASYGGMVGMGPGGQSVSEMVKPTFNASLTYVKGNHTYKVGAEERFEGYPVLSFTSAKGSYTFAAAQTSLPSTQGQNLSGGAVGFPYASFLLGLVNNGTIGDVTKSRGGKHQFGVYVQDTWKITRKLTLDYGLRYDYSTYSKENYGRGPNFSGVTMNPTVGRLGAVIYEGDLPGRCQCAFAKNYPLAFGPRLGAAYQINDRTVLRLGWGLVYTGTPNSNLANTAVSSTPFSAPSPFASAMKLETGVPLTPDKWAWPNFNPGFFPFSASNIGAAPMNLIDPNAGRPARQNQWSVGLQREITRNLVVELSYVANRGAWWQGNALLNYNALTPAILASSGLNPAVAADNTLLRSTIGSATAAARGFNRLPYSGFPTSQPVSQALRPFPHFTTINTVGAPVGNTWYDSLQLKVTKRLSRGLDFLYAFTWQKELVSGAESDSVGPGGVGASVNDVFNRPNNKYISAQSRPLVSVFSISYTTPKLSTFAGQRWLGYVMSDWLSNATLNYASGLPIQAPIANNALNSVIYQQTFANRVSGENPYTVDINCHCFDPGTTFALNPKAWTDPAAGTFGTAAAYYNDYRQPRRPGENLNFGRTFRLVERATLELRAEFSNVLNRAYFQTPTSTNAAATQVRNSAGQTAGGFGFINLQVPLAATYAAPGPRSGQVVARFRF